MTPDDDTLADVGLIYCNGVVFTDSGESCQAVSGEKGELCGK